MINQYWELIILLSLINVIFALSLNLILGYNGQFSLGHAGFIALGAYTSGVLTSVYNLPLFAGVLIAMVISTFFAVIIGYPTLRLRGDYLAIATLGFAEIIRIVLLALPADIFGGPTGMREVDGLHKYFSSPPALNSLLNALFTLLFALALVVLLLWAVWSFGDFMQRKLARFGAGSLWRWLSIGVVLLALLALYQPIARGLSRIFLFDLAFSKTSAASEQGALFAVFVILVALVTLLIANFLNSIPGRAVIAIREDEIAAMNLGINITWMKLQNFMLGSALAGLGGALLAHTVPLFQPRDFGLFRSVDVLLMVVLGGMGSLTGSFLGALLITVPLEVLRFLGPWRLVIYALLLIVLMILRPSGILGGHELKHVFPLLLRRKRAPAESPHA